MLWCLSGIQNGNKTIEKWGGGGDPDFKKNVKFKYKHMNL